MKAYGDRLKRLAAYAYQHSAGELPVTSLLHALQARSFEILSATPLGVARRHDAVAIDSGALHHTMERQALSFARFVRALRMGLGNRHDDPRVEQALALFAGGFRHKNMAGLLEIARKLREIFGWEVRLAETVGPHESLAGEGGESVIHGDGIGNEEVQREVERITNPRKRSATPSAGRGGRLWINVNASARFDRITNVVKVPFDRAAHGELVAQMSARVRALRRFLEELGMRHEPQRLRVRRGDASIRRAPWRWYCAVTRGC